MRILLTNDDGIEAPGMHALQQIASELSDDVWTVAPETDQSGSAHSLTLHEPLRLRQLADRTYAVKGTPTDCVIMAVRNVLADKRPDLVLSGVNRGANIADDVTYSGTVAGAMEGASLGIPSIALSQAYRIEDDGENGVRWETAMQLGSGLVRRLLEAGWPPHVLLNVNFPDRSASSIAGYSVTTQGKRDQDLLMVVDRMDTRGNPYYWLGFERRRSNPPEGTDLWAIYSGRISITPLHLDLTHNDSFRKLRDVAFE
jgi:5'-nucleotidase